jgi:hypothetical protein
MKNFISVLSMVFLSTAAYAGNGKSVTCQAYIKDPSWKRTVGQVSKTFLFTDDDLNNKDFVRKDLMNRNGDIFAVISKKWNGVGLYKISAAGKTKQVIFLDGDISLNDMESNVSLICY